MQRLDDVSAVGARMPAGSLTRASFQELMRKAHAHSNGRALMIVHPLDFLEHTTGGLNAFGFERVQLDFISTMFALLFHDISYVIYVGEKNYTNQRKSSPGDLDLPTGGSSVSATGGVTVTPSAASATEQEQGQEPPEGFTVEIESRAIPYVGNLEWKEFYTKTQGSDPRSLENLIRVANIVEMEFYQVWIHIFPNGRCDAGITLLDVRHRNARELLTIIDLFMPGHEDAAHFLEHMYAESWRVQDLSFSFFRPQICALSAAPEGLLLRPVDTLFFYERLGFGRPPEGVIQAIAHSRPQAFKVTGRFGLGYE
ncbi:unnamed protein product, partial [Amoebophrya sp. A25]|eukprot:GSA25T00010407001.1